MFMMAQHKGWGFSAGVSDEESCGEALSQFLTVQFQTTSAGHDRQTAAPTTGSTARCRPATPLHRI